MKLVLIRVPKRLIVHRHFIITPWRARLKIRTWDRGESRCTKAARASDCRPVPSTAGPHVSSSGEAIPTGLYGRYNRAQCTQVNNTKVGAVE